MLQAHAGGDPCGVAIACGSDLMQIAVAPEHRRRSIASALLGELHRRSADPLRILNVDERAVASLAWLRHSGARPFMQQ
ncbi:GNAT family N-acetyltransferase [Enhygromyxa salina]|uniref:GNAT family N-acetyltransferase n=1 Tax=Enhygromyxa salina TaxID=215803 RepID=UPI0011BAE25C|nr:GNAT family N-acetyltransferase [Enhygromyxa salina]